jgi:Vitamin K epoxide reductase family.
MFVLSAASLQDRYADSAGMSKLLALASGGGFLFTLWLTYLELFVIHAMCQWCVISAIIVTTIFIVSMLDLRDRSA